MNSLNCGSDAMSAFSFSGSAASTACPARSSIALTRTLCVALACRCATTVGPQSRRTSPSRHGSRSRKKRSLLWCRTVWATRSPPACCAFHAMRVERQFWQASRGGYCTFAHSAHCCSSKRPSAAAAVRPRATRLRAAGGSVGRRVRRIGFLRFGRCKDRRSGGKPPIVVDHAEPAHEPESRILHLPAIGRSGELADRLDHAEEATAGAGLSDRELAARGVEGEAAVAGEAVLADKC